MIKLLMPRGISGNEPEHISRLKSVAKWRMPPEGSAEWVRFRLGSAAAERDPRYRRELKEASKRAEGTHKIVQVNGAGLPADSGIREFLSEYNRRSANYGIHYLPASFNIFEAFSSYYPKYGVFVPIEEIDHVCSLRGFLDHQAGTSSLGSEIELRKLPENKIFNFSFIEDAGTWVLEDAAERFIVSSFSMVRHGDELTVMSLAGIEKDLTAETIQILDRRKSLVSDPEKPLLEIDPSLETCAVPLDSLRKFQRTYAGFRFDLRKEAMQVRYLLFDEGSSWNIQTDDLLTLDYASNISSEHASDKSIEAVEKRSGLFAFLHRLTGLLAYFAERSDSALSDKAITGVADLGATAKGRRQVESALRSQVIYEKRVATLLGSSLDPVAIVLPKFELNIEIEGFWERLPFGTYGVGRDGERVLGRTWVNKTLSKRQASMPGVPTSALLTGLSSVSLQDDEGFIYVLRNAAHQINMFKVGLTRRDVSTRAKELSRGTGIPDSFLTVQSWWVPDVVYAEKRIHQILDEHRLKASREFFQADYAVIRSAVDLVVSELAGRRIPE